MALITKTYDFAVAPPAGEFVAISDISPPGVGWNSGPQTLNVSASTWNGAVQVKTFGFSNDLDVSVTFTGSGDTSGTGGYGLFRSGFFFQKFDGNYKDGVRIYYSASNLNTETWISDSGTAIPGGQKTVYAATPGYNPTTPTRTMRVVLKGGLWSVYIDGALIVTFWTSVITSPLRPAFYIYALTAALDNFSCIWDDYAGVLARQATSLVFLNQPSVPNSGVVRLTKPPIVEAHGLAYAKGTGIVEGKVLVVGTPKSRKVRLYDSKTGIQVQSMWSATNGDYSFKNLDASRKYFVVGHDHEKVYNATIKDFINLPADNYVAHPPLIHRYWRLLFTAVAGLSLKLSEVKLLDSLGVNFAALKTATASSTYAGSSAANLVDTVAATEWSSANNTMPQWVQVDLGSPPSNWLNLRQYGISPTSIPAVKVIPVTPINQGIWDRAKAGGIAIIQADRNVQVTPVGATDNGVALGVCGLSYGKWYWEIKLNSGNSGSMIGIGKASTNLALYLGGGATSYGYWHTGQYYTAGVGTSFGSAHVVGDVISVLVDFTALTIEFWKNGVAQGVPKTIAAGVYFPGVSNGNTTYSNITANFKSSDFLYTPPVGYQAYNDAPLQTWDRVADSIYLKEDRTIYANPLLSNTYAAFASRGLSSGKWYWEIRINTGTDATTSIGISGPNTSLTSFIGNSGSTGYAFVLPGVFISAVTGSFGYAAPVTVGDVVGVLLDMINLTISFTKNGVANGVPRAIPANTYFPGVSTQTENRTLNVTANLKAADFAYPTPAGFTDYNDTITQAMVDQSIVDNATAISTTPTDWELQYSDDSSSWVTIDTRTANVNYPTVPRTFDLP